MARRKTETTEPEQASFFAQEAERLARTSQARIAAPRIHACLKKLCGALAPELLKQPAKLADAFAVFPLSLVYDAIESFGIERAVQLIEESDLVQLAKRIQVLEYLMQNETPFFTLPELADHTRNFRQFLEQHRAYIVKTGLLPHRFSPCPWLYWHLGRLYDVKATSAPCPADEFDPRPTVQPYTWVRKTGDPTLPEPPSLIECDYEDADLLPIFVNAHGDAHRIDRERRQLFDIKLRLLDVLAAAADRRDASQLWPEVHGVLRETLSEDAFRFYLGIDQRYLGADARDRPVMGMSPRRAPGGLTNLLAVAGHFEQEITIGMLDRTRTALGVQHAEALRTSPGAGRYQYFKVLGRPDRAAIDEVLDGALARAPHQETFWHVYRGRVRNTFYSQSGTTGPMELPPQLLESVRTVFQQEVAVLLESRDRNEPIQEPRPSDPASEAEVRNSIRFDGVDWVGYFEGESFRFGKSVGMFYIAHLLKQECTPFSASELRGQWTQFSTPGAHATSRANSAAHVLDASLGSGAPDLGEATDLDGLRKLWIRKQELESDIEKAKGMNDEADAEANCTELEQVNQAIRKAIGTKGNLTRLGKEVKKDRDQVRNAIAGALRKIQTKTPDFCRHLRASLRLDTEISYQPERPMGWVD